LKELPAELGALKELQKINLSGCRSLEKLPAVLGSLTALREIDLRYCSSLKELPTELGALTQLKDFELDGCFALHTPPPHVVEQGTGAVLEFLRDLAKGDAPCHLIKVVLLGNQRAGKSSLADLLVLGRPVTRADSDRTVGIEVRRWPVGRKSQLVVNIYDAAGQRVYRATHGLFMTAFRRCPPARGAERHAGGRSGRDAARMGGGCAAGGARCRDGRRVDAYRLRLGNRIKVKGSGSGARGD
jgi:hypothetical protein